MVDILLIPVSIFYLAVIGSLFAYGINFYYLTYIAIKSNKQKKSSPPKMSSWPRVTVQLPIYNELHVAERLIIAAANINYPPELLEIQVLDDSTDETKSLIEKTVKYLLAKNVDIKHLYREQRSGYKAGALKEGLAVLTGEFVAIFDADFIPTRDFLQKTIPHFYRPEIAFVQARWGHINANYSFVTLLQSLTIDAHFMIEQFARSQAGYWFNFNGTAGIWRRSAIIDAGGWSGETLTEDLDLSYRAFLKGWKAVYLRDLEVPAELPITLNALRRQRRRWAHGSLECAAKLLPTIWRGDYKPRQKIEATLHLTGYFVHLLLFAQVLLYPIILLLGLQYPGVGSLFGIALIFNATALAPIIFFIVAQKQLGRNWKKLLPILLFISSFGAGMMMNTVMVAIGLLRKKTRGFERTPKYGVIEKSEKRIKRRYQLKLDSIVYLELFFALFNLGSVMLAIHNQSWLIALYAALFSFGLFFTSITSIIQTYQMNKPPSKSPFQLDRQPQK